MSGRLPSLCAAAVRVHAALLLLYPPAFRREFTPQMSYDFDEASRDAWRAGGGLAMAMLWLRAAADLARTIPVQWARTGLPALLLVSPLPACAVFALAATRIGRVRPIAIAATEADREALELVLAATVVIVLLAASITIVTWLTRPLRQRHR
jgi:hypothetical protein